MRMDPRCIKGPSRPWSHCGVLSSPCRGLMVALVADSAARPPVPSPFPSLVLGASQTLLLC